MIINSLTINPAELSTSTALLEIDPAMPFSLVMLFELLLGELGPEPGALLHADSVRKLPRLMECQSRRNRCWSHALTLGSLSCGSHAGHPKLLWLLPITFSTHTMNKLWMMEPDPLTCHVQRAFLCSGDGSILPPQKRAAPALADLLLQPGPQLQIGLRS